MAAVSAFVILLVGLGTSAGAVAAGAASPAVASLAVSPPPAGTSAWQLPLPGVGNECTPGDVLSVRWESRGYFLLAEVASGKSISLCLYDVSAARFDRGSSGSVWVYPLDVGGPNAFSAVTGTTSRQLAEPGWEIAPGGSSRFITVLRSGSREQLYFGAARHAGLKPELRPVPLSAASPLSFILQPEWQPAPSGTGGNLAVISSRDDSSHCPLASVFLVQGVGDPAPKLARLTNPCTSGEAGGSIPPGDRYPSWSPGAGSRIAFVRSLPGRPSQLCVVEDVLSRPRERCLISGKAGEVFTWPTWTPDGTQLLFYRSRGTSVVTSTTSLETIPVDVRGPDPRARVLLDGVVPNERQPPAVLCRSTNSRQESCFAVVAPSDGARAVGELRLLPLQGEQGKVSFKPGLNNLRSVAVVRRKSGSLAAVVAQSYTGGQGEEADHFKIFIVPLPARDTAP